MSSGNGSSNAHNNQFGGGSRGPTGGVNTGSGPSGNTGDRGNGRFVLSPARPGEVAGTIVNGELRIEISRGMNWVADDSLHWSDGKGVEGRDNLRTNVTAPVPSGFRSAVDGYIYTVTVDGNDTITSVSLFSRPILNSRKDWKNGETTRQAQARALVQVQLDAKKAAVAAAAKKAAEEAAAAEAKRKAEEEAKRKQAEWDAAHPVEAAQRDVNNAASNASAAQNKINSDNAQISSNNAEINARQPQVDQLSKEVEYYGNQVRGLQGVDPVRASVILNTQLGPRKVKRDQLQNEINSFQSQNNALRNDIAIQTNNLNTANSQRASAQARLQKALSDAEAKRKAEAARQAAEAARVKAEQEAAAKAKAEAEAKAKAEAEAATKAAALEAARSKLEEQNVFGFAGYPAVAVSASPISFAETGLGGLVLGEVATAAAWSSIRTVIADMVGAVISGSGIGALIASIAYIPSAGEGSDQVPGREDINMFLSAMPADAINLPSDSALKTAADSNGTVEMAVRGRVYYSDNSLKTYLVRSVNPSSVRVLNASVDKVTGLYSVTIPAESGLPSRTILVSPENAPGYKGLPPLVTPTHGEAIPTDTGNQSPVNTSPVIESFPMADDMDFRDAILVFPVDSGLKPIYVMLQSARDLPGKVEGKGADIVGQWLASSGKELGVPVPTRIVNNLLGKEYRSFDAFREALWKEIATDSQLASQFNKQNVERMKNGLAPRVPMKESVGGRRSFELHHVKLISQGGEVYDVDNIRVVTPKRHIEIHSNK
ncbi:S-type pyocin domain-containing protein [Pantoea dispersa]|uniref:S-type pyocin domain-containing protein n=1 Tax=Pantoea dispersa TaxID=59814 RepID=UPI002DB94240|nr:S-type pyocin domain-containing protein [Pantoea dispersa]MEB5837034.1 S-type pyocin domain-containing protein [Pantoea dispersa]